MMNLIDTWPIGGPCDLTPVTNGVNSKIWRVTSPTGEYFLRQYRPGVDLPRVRYEIEVLRQLDQQGLSFAVAVPVLTRAGDRLHTADGAVYTLVRAIPGSSPDRQSTEHAAAVGEALGELVGGLAAVRPACKPPTVKTYGDLGSIHPAVPDPLAVLSELPLDEEQQAKVARFLERVMAATPGAYATLPRQQIHGDPVYVNLLIEQGRISGILDFEFTCHDLRSMDLASVVAGWAMTGAKGLAPGQEWELIEAFGQAYARRQPMTAAEIEALPLLIRLRRSAIFANFAGLFLSGSAPLETLTYGVDSAIAGEEWLERNGAELQRRARAWQRLAKYRTGQQTK